MSMIVIHIKPCLLWFKGYAFLLYFFQNWLIMYIYCVSLSILSEGFLTYLKYSCQVEFMRYYSITNQKTKQKNTNSKTTAATTKITKPFPIISQCSQAFSLTNCMTLYKLFNFFHLSSLICNYGLLIILPILGPWGNQ